MPPIFLELPQGHIAIHRELWLFSTVLAIEFKFF